MTWHLVVAAGAAGTGLLITVLGVALLDAHARVRPSTRHDDTALRSCLRMASAAEGETPRSSPSAASRPQRRKARR